ncbi:pyridoxamine 5'-phosphate oxidase [Algoriphagus sp. CAU 1675]|uniref:pyridoxamine 5'-phosphate oxidase n=1 Tax=Algoriphagus sp. CAU 1675 TaxID=3032597 RepID=UPI0023DB469B|nr:pyridoxamine 5'-phosphate oxidase [Algoriphagus sp. CAU 1675]MDF2157931.1 pyridoxamine 5'-phosphate oxidase [Algoriphagus sp. CAU 1675]
MNIASIRKEYALKTLGINDVNSDPIHQFREWFKEAMKAEVLEVNAMTLSTLGLDGIPNGRILLLKDVDHGFVFFSNYQSEKGKELENLSKGALTFYWAELERQVRIKGEIEKVSSQLSDEYYFSRPYGSQIGAWASPQSQKIKSRDFLDENHKVYQQKFESEPIQRPEHWGGYRLNPVQMEFWQGRPSRLHDRILYEKNEAGNWSISRLAP